MINIWLLLAFCSRVIATKFHRNPERALCYQCTTKRIGAAYYVHDESFAWDYHQECSTNNKVILDANFRNHSIYCEQDQICGVLLQQKRWSSYYSTYNLTRGCFPRMKIHEACTDIHEEWIEPGQQGEMLYSLACQCEGHFCNDWTYNSLVRRYWTEVTPLTSSISYFSLVDDPYLMSTTWSKSGHKLGVDWRQPTDECCFTNLTNPWTPTQFGCYRCALELDADAKGMREGAGGMVSDELCTSNNKQVLDRLYRFRRSKTIQNMGGCQVMLQELQDEHTGKYYSFKRGYISDLTAMTENETTKLYNGCSDQFPILPDQYLQDQFQMTCACASDYCNDYTFESIFKRFNDQTRILLQESSRYLPINGTLPGDEEDGSLI